MRRKICVVTGTRAEYGLLYWLLREIEQDPELQLQLVACAAHLCPEQGMTVEQIEADGFTIDARVEMLVAGDSRVAMAKSTGLGVIGFADAFTRLQPDIIVILGDRFEMLAAAQTAMLLEIPIAHIHGGEITAGAVDDSIRHAITKMASLHFTATERFRQRLIQMGEPPQRVFNAGAPGLEQLRRCPPLSREQLAAALDFDLGPPLFLVTFHPVTRGAEESLAALGELCRALEQFPNARILWTAPNADAEGRALRRQIEQWATARSDRVLLTVSLGQQRYLSALRLAEVVIGNSSSGIIEAPAAGTPTVNIGSRQEGRPRAASVLHCCPKTDAVRTTIQAALSRKFREKALRQRKPYGNGKSAGAIVHRIKQATLSGISQKQFHDLSGIVTEEMPGSNHPATDSEEEMDS